MHSACPPRLYTSFFFFFSTHSSLHFLPTSRAAFRSNHTARQPTHYQGEKEPKKKVRVSSQSCAPNPANHRRASRRAPTPSQSVLARSSRTILFSCVRATFTLSRPGLFYSLFSYAESTQCHTLRHNSCIVPFCDRSTARTTPCPLCPRSTIHLFCAALGVLHKTEAMQKDMQPWMHTGACAQPLGVTLVRARPMQGTDRPPTALASPPCLTLVTASLLQFGCFLMIKKKHYYYYFIILTACFVVTFPSASLFFPSDLFLLLSDATAAMTPSHLPLLFSSSASLIPLKTLSSYGPSRGGGLSSTHPLAKTCGGARCPISSMCSNMHFCPE